MPKNPDARKNRDKPAKAEKLQAREEKRAARKESDGPRDMQFDDRLAAVTPGGKITGLNVGKKNPDVTKIEVNGEVVARVDKRDLPSAGISVGTVWSTEVANRVTAAVARTKARNAAKTLLEEKQVAKTDLVERLTNRGHDRQVVESILGEM